MDNDKELTHIDLFSGIGGFTLAAEWAGFKTIVFCEKEEFCQKVLKARFGAIIADSKSMGRRDGVTKNNGKKSRKIDSFGNQAPLLIPEIRDFDGTKWRGATLLTGGFPCQPFSVAGQRRGKEDDRYLWPEMLRVISEAKPRWILAENVPGIFRMALDTVLSDLEGEGYTTGTFIIPACGLNAPHRRNRIWIVAHINSEGSLRMGQERGGKSGWELEQSKQERGAMGSINARCDSHAPDSKGRLLRGIRNKGEEKRTQDSDELFGDSYGLLWQEDWNEVAARFCRVDDGIPDRIHRLKALGNAIVPQIAYEILKNIAWIEKNYSVA